MSSSKRLPAHALIIAINDLHGGLQAPEQDAVRLYSMLVSLGIPPTSIDTLVGPSATRQGIIQKLNDIADSRRIPQDAPILVYFAGHAAQQNLNIAGASRAVEFIVPYDALLRTAQPIPDVSISALVGRIARKKSKHITLILDCCHAGGASRDDNVDDSFQPDLEIDASKLAMLDQELWSEALANTDNAPAETGSAPRASHNNRHPLSFRYGGVTSHVLIASCHESQKSQEFRVPPNPPQGLFTTALLEALDECKADRVLWSVTHTGLFERIKEIMRIMRHDHPTVLRFPQVPQLEGYHKDRPVFSTPSRPHGSHSIAPLVETPDKTVLLPVGGLGGVQRHTTFEIFDYSQGRLGSMGKFRVANLSDSQAILNPGRALQLGVDAYAVMCTPPTALPVEMFGDFPALYSDKSFQADLARAFGTHEPLSHFITPVRSGYKVRASYTQSRDQIELQNVHGGVLLFHGVRQAPGALVQAAMFFHHLEQTATSAIASADMLSVWIHELAEVSNGDVLRGDMNALAPRWDRAIPMHPTRGCAVSESDASFGLQIVNRGVYHLYVYVFYFDPNDYSISPLYLPTTSDVPLISGRDLTIGYGNSGAAPLSFTLANGMEEDKGFIKIYYSTFPSEMGFIEQDGFEDGRNSRPSNSAYSPATVFGSIAYPVTVFCRHQ